MATGMIPRCRAFGAGAHVPAAHGVGLASARHLAAIRVARSGRRVPAGAGRRLRVAAYVTDSPATATTTATASAAPATKVKLAVPSLRLADGERLCVVGACPELGAWDLGAAPALALQEGGDKWEAELTLLPGSSTPFKLAILKPDGSSYWEEGQNRLLQLPSPSSPSGGDGGADAGAAPASALLAVCRFGDTNSTALEALELPLPGAEEGGGANGAAGKGEEAPPEPVPVPGDEPAAAAELEAPAASMALAAELEELQSKGLVTAGLAHLQGAADGQGQAEQEPAPGPAAAEAAAAAVEEGKLLTQAAEDSSGADGGGEALASLLEEGSSSEEGLLAAVAETPLPASGDEVAALAAAAGEVEADLSEVLLQVEQAELEQPLQAVGLAAGPDAEAAVTEVAEVAVADVAAYAAEAAEVLAPAPQEPTLAPAAAASGIAAPAVVPTAPTPAVRSALVRGNVPALALIFLVGHVLSAWSTLGGLAAMLLPAKARRPAGAAAQVLLATAFILLLG